MPLPKGPQLTVTVPSGKVSEPLREDVHGELARLVEALQWVPASRQVWEVTEA